MKNVIRMSIAWDLDGDISHDLQSDDEEMRQFAKSVNKTGLTKDYAKKNLLFLVSNLGIDSKLFEIVLNFPDRFITISGKKKELTYKTAEKLIKSGDLNVNESGEEGYVQLFSYFQLNNICFIDSKEKETPISIL